MPLKNIFTESLMMFVEAVFLGLLNAHLIRTFILKYFIFNTEFFTKTIFLMNVKDEIQTLDYNSITESYSQKLEKLNLFRE